MPKTPKEKPQLKKDEKEPRDKASWSEDQKERGYYYDDAHGYEVYHSEDDNLDDSHDDPIKPRSQTS